MEMGWLVGIKMTKKDFFYYSRKTNKTKKDYFNLFDKEEEFPSEKHLFVTHTYGFPFAYGIGLNYMKTDNYFISADISSSFVFSGVSVGGGKHLFNELYAAMSVNGIYHGYTTDDTHKLDIGITPKLTYVLDKKNKLTENELEATLNKYFLIK